MLKAGKTLEMYPSELKQVTILEPQNTHYGNEPNRAVEEALEV